MARSGLACVLLLATLGAYTAHASTLFTLHTLAGDPTGEVLPGDTIDMLVRYVSTDSVGSVFFTVRLPEEGWTLVSYNLSDYGWYQGDNFWDNSDPQASATPIAVMNDTYSSNPAHADFMISTIYDPFDSEETGEQDVMRFTLGVPGSTVPGEYFISLHNLDLTDGSGNSLSNVTAGDPFELSVLPESGTLAMLVLGLGLLGGLWRRRAGLREPRST